MTHLGTLRQVHQPERHDLPLDALAARVGEELDMLALLAADVQMALSMCHFPAQTDPAAIRGLQGIDRITQALEDLGRLMTAVSGEISQNVFVHAVPILSRLRMHEMLQNLDPSKPGAQKAAADAAGAVDWF